MSRAEFYGKSSSMRLTAWSAMRERTLRKIRFGVEAVEFGGAHRAVNRRGAFATPAEPANK